MFKEGLSQSLERELLFKTTVTKHTPGCLEEKYIKVGGGLRLLHNILYFVRFNHS